MDLGDSLKKSCKLNIAIHTISVGDGMPCRSGRSEHLNGARTFQVVLGGKLHRSVAGTYLDQRFSHCSCDFQHNSSAKLTERLALLICK